MYEIEPKNKVVKMISGPQGRLNVSDFEITDTEILVLEEGNYCCEINSSPKTLP